MPNDFAAELIEEASDFFEDLGEIAHIRKRRQPKIRRKAFVGGVLMTVRPAYLFAERVENLLKALFAGSIIVSAVSSSILGFTKLSDLLSVLITTSWGRGLMAVIGGSYFLIAVWKLTNLEEQK